MRLEAVAPEPALDTLPVFALLPPARHRMLHAFFREHSAFGRLPVEALRRLLSSLERVAVAPRERIITEGEPAGPMYVVEEGRLRVFTDEPDGRRDLAYLRRGDFLGERSLLLEL